MGKLGFSDNKIYQQVGDGGKALSGGEKKRLSLVRAIISDTPIVILDEIVSNLDKENKEKAENIIIKESKKRCIILITHDEIYRFKEKADCNIIDMERSKESIS